MIKQPTYDEEKARLGKQLVIHLVILLKTAHIHDSANEALAQPAENLLNTLQMLLSESDDLMLALYGDLLVLGDIPLKVDMECFSSFIFLMDEMKKRATGKFIFKRGLTAYDLRRFCAIFVRVDSKATDPFPQFTANLRSAHLENPGIDLLRPVQEAREVSLENHRAVAKLIYFKTVTAVSDVMTNAKFHRAVGFLQAKRVVQSMVDAMLQEESTLLGLTNLKCHDEYTYNHAVNVCILAMSVGQRLGYTKPQLCNLGLAALLHDLGKYRIPLEVLNKPDELNEAEWVIMRQHPIYSVCEIVRSRGIDSMSARVTIGAFEHHLNYDSSGYPRLANSRKLTLLGRIVSIVDCYDALTSSRVYNRTPYPPSRALQIMLGKSGTAFDPALMKLFVNAVGVFPIGTLVLLNTHDIGVVFASNPNMEMMSRPRVRLILNAAGDETKAEMVDLSERDGEGRFRYEIQHALDPSRYPINVAGYFL